MALPVMQGEGLHPPADACDFARYCSDLDFFALTEHAELLTPQQWQDIKASIRQCNAISGDPEDPDLVAFIGWEWTQLGLTADTHYGHRNVILKSLNEDDLPARPISARNPYAGANQPVSPLAVALLPLLNPGDIGIYTSILAHVRAVDATPPCPADVDTRELPPDCHESAPTPRALFEKLARWDSEALVIPHGTTWGYYTPPGTNFAKQVSAQQHDPEYQRLFEIYSGHGNSEEYRPWRAVARDSRGRNRCPEPTDDFLPCCWRAGEIIAQRCGDIPDEECEARVLDARQRYVDAQASGHRTIPDANLEDWMECGQCLDCFLPAFNYRPGNSAQFVLASRDFADSSDPAGIHVGFVGSSDNHTARPGTGYKEYDRQNMTDTWGPRSRFWRDILFDRPPDPEEEAAAVDPFEEEVAFFDRFESERMSTFFLTGGLAAVHADGRSRDAIWDALHRREVYGTSGDRILLWFHLLEGEDEIAPMGARRVYSPPSHSAAPRFRVRAVGSLEPEPGCPEHSASGLASARRERLCRGECYNPGDERRIITRIEVVRIRPQTSPDEDVTLLIEDPWIVSECAPDPSGCIFEFTDPEFETSGRDAIYYVRAIQEATETVAGDPFRCVRDERGECIDIAPCYGDFRLDNEDDCLTLMEERAWASPIFLVQP